jgi:hypothetical protein
VGEPPAPAPGYAALIDAEVISDYEVTEPLARPLREPLPLPEVVAPLPATLPPLPDLPVPERPAPERPTRYEPAAVAEEQEAIRVPSARRYDLTEPERDTAGTAPAQSDPEAKVERTPAADRWASGFTPANETEESLFQAAEENNTDTFLSTLLLAKVVVPVPPGTPGDARPSDPRFPWQLEEIDGQPYISVFTSAERLAEHAQSRRGGELASVQLKFVQLISAWPDEEISFAVNPGSPVGATLPGSQIVALASWASEVGLRDEPEGGAAEPADARAHFRSAAGARVVDPRSAIMMQKTLATTQVPYYLERGYDRVSGFVHRVSEVERLNTPRQLYHGLGLSYAGSPFSPDDAEVYVLRWGAHRGDLYRIPYGGQHEAGMRAMQGWVIERPPFRGNGFASGDSGDVIAEFKVDSVRLPHGAQLWRLDKEGNETFVATFEADGPRWLTVDTPFPLPTGGTGA